MTIGTLGNGEDQEECGGESDACFGRQGLRKQIHDGRGEQDQEFRCQANRNFTAGGLNVGWDLRAAFALVLVPWDEHGRAVEGETADHTEGVSFTQPVHVSATGQNRKYLEKYGQ